MKLALLMLAAACGAAPAGSRPRAPAPASPGPASPRQAGRDARVTLLDGRLTVELPAGMRLEPRAHDLMAAETSGEDETRAVTDVGAVRFVMMTYELYLGAGGDLAAAVAAEETADGNPSAKLEPLAVARPLVAYAVAPAPGQPVEDANLVLSVWIASPDHTVQLIGFYVNPAGAADAARWAALARRIAGTLAAGPRQLELAAGDRKLGDLTIRVPEGWTLATQPGPDFTVYHLRALGTLGGDAGSTCSVYVGDFPSYQYVQAGIDASKVGSSPGTLLGASVAWKTWSTPDASLTEAMAPHGGEQVHVFCAAKTDRGLAALRSIAETLR